MEKNINISLKVRLEEGKHIDELEREFESFCDEMDREFEEFDALTHDVVDTVEFETKKTEGHFDHVQETIELHEPDVEQKDDEFRELKTSWGNPAYIRDIYQ